VVEVVLPMDPSGHVNPHLPIALRANRAFGDFQVEVGLQPDPELGRDAKVFAQSERSVSGDSALSIDNIADAPWRDSDIPGEPINADAHRLHEFFQKDLPWMNPFGPFLARHISSGETVGVELLTDGWVFGYLYLCTGRVFVIYPFWLVGRAMIEGSLNARYLHVLAPNWMTLGRFLHTWLAQPRD
jgi:hypothetical protein